MHTEEARTCKACGEEKPIDRFQFGSSVAHGRKYRYRKHTCRICVKRQQRRRNGSATRDEISARAIQRRSAKQRARDANRALALRTVRALLGKLFVQRCASRGLNADALDYRLRYRNDGAFREREIARRWAKKVQEQELYRTIDDGSLDAHTLIRLFAEAAHCPYCGQPLHSRDKTLDHVVPKAKGGLHSIGNVCVCCRRCNTRKGARTPEEMGWPNPTTGVACPAVEVSYYGRGTDQWLRAHWQAKAARRAAAKQMGPT